MPTFNKRQLKVENKWAFPISLMYDWKPEHEVN